MYLYNYISNTLRSRASDLSQRHVEWARVALPRIGLSCPIYVCEHCNSVAKVINASRVRVNARNLNDTELWCETCCHDDAFYCERSNRHFMDAVFSSIEVDGIDLCLEYYHDELYYWESDGTYHWERESEEEESSDPRDDYHGSSRSWYIDVTKHDPLGCELELRAKDKDSLGRICDSARELGLIAEYDGSLDGELGVEIVGPPIPLKDYRHGIWSKFIDDVGSMAVGWNAGTGYGMHVSTDTRVLSGRLGIGKMLAWYPSNKMLCELVAGRREIHWAKYTPKKPHDYLRFKDEKYEAAAWRGRSRIEVRIFRSTLKFASFLKNVQFVQATAEFTRSHGIRSLGDTGAFIRMVASSNRYRELAEFIQRTPFKMIETISANPSSQTTEQLLSVAQYIDSDSSSQ